MDLDAPYPVAPDAAVHSRAEAYGADLLRGARAARPLEPPPNQPTPSAPPLDPEAPVPDDPGPLEEPDLLPPPPLEPSPDVVPQAEPV